MFRFFFVYFTLKHCFSPVHLWVAKYSCISVWNDWETTSGWHTLQLHHGGSALRQQATRSTDWVHLKGILAQKKRRENVERKKTIIICFPHADAFMQFQIPDVKLMFYLLWMCMERKRGDIKRRFGWLLLDCDCCTGQEALRMQHRKRRASLIILEWTEISCKAEMLCLGQTEAELWSANKLGFCAAVLHYWHPCTAVWKHLLPHLLYKPFGNKL